MPNHSRLLFACAVLLLAALACASPTPMVPTTDPNGFSTIIAQTVAAALTQTGQPQTPTSVAQASSTPEAPTLTPTITASPTQLLTATPSVPLISVSVPTNCRVGPGKVYDRVGALLVDETAEVFGLDPTGKYWYIRNPDPGPEYCWLWGEYATLVGNLSALPIFTPPPTPTPVPAFEAAFKKLETCSGNWWVDFELKNTGGITFKSVSITLRDVTANVVLALATDGFTDKNGCTNSTVKDNLHPGGAHIVSMTPFVYDPTGHELRATVTLCAEKNNAGQCVSHVIEFKP